MLGYVSKPGDEIAAGRMRVFSRVMYVEQALLVLLGVVLMIRLWPFMMPSESDSGAFNDVTSFVCLMALVASILWTFHDQVLRPFTAACVFRRLLFDEEGGASVLRLDRTVRRYRHWRVGSTVAKPDDTKLYQFQASQNAAAAAYAAESNMAMRKRELE